MTYARNSSPIPIPRDTGSAPRISGAKSHIFQPPRSTYSESASSSLILTRSITSNSTTAISSGARKRSRAESPRDEECSRYGNYEPDIYPESPMPFVNTKYVLAGGMDTPTLKAAQLAMQGDSEYNDVGYRKSLEGARRGLFNEAEPPSYFPPDGRQGNGRPIGWGSPSTEGWGKVVGGVVGKIWEFGTAVFRGFHAGGGQKYSVSKTDSCRFFQDPAENASYWESEKQPTSFWGQAHERESTPIPGRFPEEDYIPDYMDYHAAQTPTENRTAKRRQVSRNNTVDESLTKNWVMVKPSPETFTPTQSKPKLPQPKGPARYSMPTTASTGRRSTTRPASRASFRPQATRVSHAGSPALNPRQGASFASPRPSPNSPSKIPRPSLATVGTAGATPVSPAAKEAQRWAAKKKAEEREADESIRRLDRQLKAMIREGKEALGTKVSVEFEDDFEGVKKWDF